MLLSVPAYHRTTLAKPKLVRMAVRTARKVLVISDCAIYMMSVKAFFMRFCSVDFEGPDELQFPAFWVNSYSEGLLGLFASTHNSECLFTYWSYFCHNIIRTN